MPSAAPVSPMQTATPVRIAVLNFQHETVTFLPNDTTLADFTYAGSPAKGEDLLRSDPKGYMGGFVKVAREYAGVELVGIESPLDSLSGTGSGWITHEAFEQLTGVMMRELALQGPFDGVYLALHGAMAVRGVARPEAELARRVRAVVGPDAVIAGTFDPHANEDEAFLQSANLAFAVKYYPHYDAFLQGERAARTLVRAVRGDYQVTHVTHKVPVISPTVLQWTGASPWMDLVQRALTWEAREPDVYVNVLFGFPWADVPDAGMTIQVMTNNQPALAARIADDMGAWAWARRHALLNTAKVHLINDGVALAREAVAQGQTPVVLADHSDRSGSATWVLEAVIAQSLRNTLLASLTDARTLDDLFQRKIQVGDTIEIEAGGRVDASAGAPVRVSGVVSHLIVSDISGAPALQHLHLRFGDGNLLILSRYLMQARELSDLEILGVDPYAFDVIAIKSRVHFRRGFDDSGFAKTILLVEPPEAFLGTIRLDGLQYQHLPLQAFYPYGDPVYPRGKAS